MAISPSAALKTGNSIPIPGGRCKYTGQSVRALPTRILTVGRTRSQGVQLIVDEYINKLKCYCRVEDVRIRSNPKNSRDIMAQIEHEDTALMHLIRSDDWVVMLDEHGLDIESEQVAELIGDAGNTGASRLLFCIGGPYGHGKQLRQRANISIKLSSLVLNHQIALVVLMEQLYRNTNNGKIPSPTPQYLPCKHRKEKEIAKKQKEYILLGHGLFLGDKNTITRDLSHGLSHAYR